MSSASRRGTPPNDDDRPDVIQIQYQPSGRAARRLTFESRPESGYAPIEEVWSGCGYWREVGCEPVDDVAIDAPQEVFEDGE